jgi:hypothetical protein
MHSAPVSQLRISTLQYTVTYSLCFTRSPWFRRIFTAIHKLYCVKNEFMKYFFSAADTAGEHWSIFWISSLRQRGGMFR